MEIRLKSCPGATQLTKDNFAIGFSAKAISQKAQLFADYFSTMPHNNFQELSQQSPRPHLSAKLLLAESETPPNSLFWNILQVNSFVLTILQHNTICKIMKTRILRPKYGWGVGVYTLSASPSG
jgi:hypothetical protein